MRKHAYTKEQVLAKMRKAYQAGTLTAQIPLDAEWGTGKTKRKGPAASYFAQVGKKVYRCAVGQLFSKNEAEELQYGQALYMLGEELVRKGLIVITDEPDKTEAGRWLRDIQVKHDKWCGATYLHSRAEGEFKQAIGLA